MTDFAFFQPGLLQTLSFPRDHVCALLVQQEDHKQVTAPAAATDYRQRSLAPGTHMSRLSSTRGGLPVGSYNDSLPSNSVFLMPQGGSSSSARRQYSSTHAPPGRGAAPSASAPLRQSTESGVATSQELYSESRFVDGAEAGSSAGQRFDPVPATSRPRPSTSEGKERSLPPPAYSSTRSRGGGRGWDDQEPAAAPSAEEPFARLRKAVADYMEDDGETKGLPSAGSAWVDPDLLSPGPVGGGRGGRGARGGADTALDATMASVDIQAALQQEEAALEEFERLEQQCQAESVRNSFVWVSWRCVSPRCFRCCCFCCCCCCCWLCGWVLFAAVQRVCVPWLAGRV
mgnify:CR=1 FL=1